jgi:hypothetical protein
MGCETPVRRLTRADAQPAARGHGFEIQTEVSDLHHGRIHAGGLPNEGLAFDGFLT